MNKNCHNFRISHDIHIKLGPVTKLDKGNTATSKNFDDEIISVNYDVIYGIFAAIQKPDSGRIFYKTYIFANNNLLSYKN